MAKDPAMLWYWSDWSSGTLLLSRFLKGCYIDILSTQFHNGPLSLEEIKTCLGSDFGTSWPALQKKFKQTTDGLFFNERLEHEKEKRKSYTESRRQSRLKTDEDNVKIYLIRDLDTGFFKIGSSVNPLRRFAEMCNQENPAITVGCRNYELFWVSLVCKRSFEKELHEKFVERRIKGEWFKLSDEDLLSISNSYEGTYVKRMNEHTKERMENENRNINNKKVFNKNTVSSDLQLLPEIKANASIQLLKITRQQNVTAEQINKIWEVFKVQNLTGINYYANEDAVYSHFINWVKGQKFEEQKSIKSNSAPLKSAHDV